MVTSAISRSVVRLPSWQSRPPDRNLNSTIHAFFCKHEIDLASKFVRNEVAYKCGAVAGWVLKIHRWTAKLAPDQGQVGHLSVRLKVPIDGYLAAWDRQGAIFRGVRGEFVQHPRHRLNFGRIEHDVGPADRRIGKTYILVSSLGAQIRRSTELHRPFP